MPRRPSYFGLEEANALIPTLDYLFRQLLLLKSDMVMLQHTLIRGGATVDAKGVKLSRFASRELKSARGGYYHCVESYDTLIEEILELGVELVNPDAGIVHFYSWWDEEEVVLSWQYGEPTVQFWCDPGELFTARRPIRQIFYDVPAGRAVRH